MREGKLAAQAWPMHADAEPQEIQAHRALLSDLAEELGSLTEEQREHLLAIYDAAKQRDRPSELNIDAMAEVIDDRTLARVSASNDHAAQRHASDLASFRRPTQRALDILSKLNSDAAPLFDFAETMEVLVEIGRLCGPLWLSGRGDDFPELPDLALNAALPALSVLTTTSEVWDERRGQLITVNLSDRTDEIVAAVSNAVADSRHEYFKLVPTSGPLPSGRAARDEEMKRRTGERLRAERDAHSAVENLLAPIREWQERLNARVAEHERQAAEVAEAAARALRRERASEGHDMPAPQPYGVSARGAELWVRDVIRHFGAADAEVTTATNDGGVDVLTERHAVSVKHYTGSVPVEEVREIFAVAIQRGLQAVLFTSGSITQAGLDFASVAPVALIRYDVGTASLAGLTSEGTALVEQGFGTTFYV
ncbi:hypothetical protein B5M43_014735 [Microbacterium sp. MEC084]|uniref:restriction endonuclease n=1 Tax=Microbacterium sp. MEC084 TaxID=1963027 RepID=UPI0014318EEF|nr:restriction endonuclease [Microbacterium sp. MEC084]MCD1270062.1 hypothetical protein [Microbacterium sp. MEC084]